MQVTATVDIAAMKTSWLKRCIPVVSATVLMSGLLALLIIVSSSELVKPEMTTIREVKFSLPSPPPPPPPPPIHVEQSIEAPSLDISISGDGPTLITSEISLKGAIDVEEITPPEPKAMTPDWDTLLKPNWDAVGLDQLDAPPRLLTSLKIDYPSSLSKRGISKVSIEIDVMIDETGKVVLRQILGSPHKDIITPLKKVISRARFTAPQKDGVAVRASFIWPLEFTQ
jgi:hypothetical protein